MSALVEEIGQSIEPVSLAIAKSHFRVTTNQEDELIKLYISSARELLENDTNLSFITKSYRQSFDAFPYRSLEQQFVPNDQMDYGVIRYWNRLPNYAQRIKLSKSPLVHVSKISYLALQSNAWQDLFPAPMSWKPLEEYSVGDQIADPGGKLQEVTTATPPEGGEDGEEPTSGATIPTFASTPGATTNDGDLIWTCKGIAPSGDFIYDRDSQPPRLFPFSGDEWPSVVRAPNAVVVYFTAGYGDDVGVVPARAKVAILQIANNWYENRESVTAADLKQIPTQFDSLVRSLKILDFAPTRG